MQPRKTPQRKAHTQKHEKGFKLKHRGGLSSCRFCHSGYQWKLRRGTRPRRSAVLHVGDYDGALDITFDGRNALHLKDPKSNRHHDGTRRRLAYRAAARWKATLRGS